jgi:hypothetical protein
MDEIRIRAWKENSGRPSALRLHSRGMTRSQIEAAIERNIPFTLRMADGKEYAVPHRDYIFLPPKSAVVVVSDDKDHVYVLPLLTMTGLSYQGSVPA